MNLKNLIKSWSLPDRSNERIQVTLRVPFTDYARLHALKEVYSTRSVNEILTDIIRLGLDEVVEALPSRPADDEDVQISDMTSGGIDCIELGDLIGPSVTFESAYRRIIESKSEDSSKESTS
jgi:hypothetical protein